MRVVSSERIVEQIMTFDTGVRIRVSKPQLEFRMMVDRTPVRHLLVQGRVEIAFLRFLHDLADGGRLSFELLEAPVELLKLRRVDLTRPPTDDVDELLPVVVPLLGSD